MIPRQLLIPGTQFPIPEFEAWILERRKEVNEHILDALHNFQTNKPKGRYDLRNFISNGRPKWKLIDTFDPTKDLAMILMIQDILVASYEIGKKYKDIFLFEIFKNGEWEVQFAPFCLSFKLPQKTN